MTIAPLMEYEGGPEGTYGPLELRGPRATLGVVGPGIPANLISRQVRQRRALASKWRRRVILSSLIAGLVVVLALPLSTLGGAVPSRSTGADGVVGATMYVVQPGDTVQSIAERFGGTDSRSLTAALMKEAGSASVVPGERLLVP